MQEKLLLKDNVNTTLDTIGGIEPHYESDEGPGWAPLVRRLTAAGKSKGLSVLTVHVMVDEHGNPLHWTKPSVCHVEPKARGKGLEALLRALAGGE